MDGPNENVSFDRRIVPILRKNNGMSIINIETCAFHQLYTVVLLLLKQVN